MLNNINNEDLNLTSSIAQQAKLSAVDNKTVSKNPYAKTADIGDVVDISDQAKKLNERDKDIEKFKSMVMDSLNQPDDTEQTNTVLNSIKTGDYVTNDQLAEKMLKGGNTSANNELLNTLFSDSDISGTNPFSDLK